MKKFLVALAVVLLIAGAATFLYRDRIGMIIAFSRLKPAQDFATHDAARRTRLFAVEQLGSTA